MTSRGCHTAAVKWRVVRRQGRLPLQSKDDTDFVVNPSSLAIPEH